MFSSFVLKRFLVIYIKLILYFFWNSDISDVKKIGEGTYGEVFKANNNICKIVPIDGDSLVNGETQKVKIYANQLIALLLWSVINY